MPIPGSPTVTMVPASGLLSLAPLCAKVVDLGFTSRHVVPSGAASLPRAPALGRLSNPDVI